jgi:hypothetical protein
MQALVVPKMAGGGVSSVKPEVVSLWLMAFHFAKEAKSRRWRRFSAWC